MPAARAFSQLIQPDQWARCVHDRTALLPGGGVELSWLDGPAAGTVVGTCEQPATPVAGCGSAPDDGRPRPSGLAFDRWCNAYLSRPELGRVDLLQYSGASAAGARRPGVLRYPGGLAVDRRQRLYLTETLTGLVHVIDLAGERLLRRVPVGCGRPIDVSPDCGRAVVLVDEPPSLVLIDGRRGPRPGPRLVRPCFPSGLRPYRICPGPLILWRNDDGDSVITRPDGEVVVAAEQVHDLDARADGLLVLAGPAGQPLRRFQLGPAGPVELEPLTAPGFDGAAIALAPNGRIAFSTATGLGWTSGSAARHETAGSVTSYRFDSGAYRTRWGRVLLQACLPEGTSIGLRFVSTDSDDLGDELSPAPPARGGVPVSHPELTPPLAPAYLLDTAAEWTELYRRPDQAAQGALFGATDPAGTDPASANSASANPASANPASASYEAPVQAPPGRYLWVQFRLYGNEQVSPRLQAVRIERPGHQLLGALPRSFSRQEADADFLQRMLAPAEAMLHELDQFAEHRDQLLSARAVPGQALDWLAGLTGLVLDKRWPEAAQRALVAEAYSLFRRRGTKQALVRILQLYLGYPPAIVEQWQLRGLGGTVLGTTPPAGSIGALAAPAVGGAARTSGTLGRFTVGDATPSASSYAHRFTVLLAGTLSDEQREVVTDIIAVHRPAHTLAELCELGDGMRVGSQLRVGLSSYVAPCRDADSPALGELFVGRDSVLGRPVAGTRLDQNARVGQVRLG